MIMAHEEIVCHTLQKIINTEMEKKVKDLPLQHVQFYHQNPKKNNIISYITYPNNINLTN